MAPYSVKSRNFEGPMDLLLDLVNSRKLFVNDVSLAEVTDDFLRYIESTEEIPLGESAEFILVASTLLLIKSRSLLPGFLLTEEEEEDIHELEERLVLYARAKDLGEMLRPLFGSRVIFEKEPREKKKLIFAPSPEVNKENLHQILESLIESLPKEEVLPKVVVKKVISLEEMIEKFAERVRENGKFLFKKDMKHRDKVSVIVGFLAMLELVKRGAIRVTQKGSDIEIESEVVKTPTYA